MSDVIEELQININSSATSANDAIDRLVTKLDRLTNTLGRVNGTSLRSLANGVERLGNSMQVMNTISTADFTRLANNLTRLGAIDFQAINNTANSLNSLGTAFTGLQAINDIRVSNFSNLARSISALNNVDISSLTRVADAMPNIARSFNRMGAISTNAKDFGTLANNIAKLAARATEDAITNIPRLGESIRQLFDTLSNLPAIRTDITQIITALGQISRQGSNAGNNANNLVRGLNRTTSATKRASNGFKGLASYIGKFYASFFMVIRGIKKLWSSIEGTADYIEAYNYFNVALGKIGSESKEQYAQYGYDNAEAYAESFSKRLSESLNSLSGVNVSTDANGNGLLTESGMKNLGLNIQEVTQYAAQLASVTNSVGQTGETSLAIAKNFTRLAGDISSLFNVDYSSVSKNLQSGLIGQSRALYKYGIDITNATLQTYAYNLGIEKAVKDMTQGEKMQLRYLAVLDQSKVSWADLANTINSPSNMLRQFTTNLKEVGMVIGQLFIPVLQKVLPVVNGIAIAFKRLFVDLASFLGVDIDLNSFGQGYTELEEDLEDDTEAFEDATSAAKEYKNQLLGFDEVNKLSDNTDNATSTTSADTIDLTDQILAASSEYEKVWQAAYDKMESQATTIANKVEKALKPLKNIGKYLLTGKNLEAGTELANWINKGLTDFDWGAVGEFIGDHITGTFDFIAGFTNTLNWTKLATDMTDAINGVIRNIKPSSIASAINGLLNGLWDLAFTFITKLDYKEIVKTIGGILKNLDWTTVIQIMSTIIAVKWIGKAISNGASAIASTASSALSNVFSTGLTGASIGISAGLGTALVVGMGMAIKSAQEEAEYWENYRQWLVDISMPNEEWQARIDELADITDTLVTESNERIQKLGDIDVNYQAIKDMATEYFDLAEKQNKSNTETDKMKTLHDTLIKAYPEFEKILDDEKTSYKDQREELEKLISEMQNKAKQQAAEEGLVEAYKAQIKEQDNLTKATEEYSEAYAQYEEDKKTYESAREEYLDYLDKVKNGQWKYGEELVEAKNKMDKANESYSQSAAAVLGVRKEVNKAKDALEQIEGEIESYSNAFSDSVDTASEKSKKISDDTQKVLDGLTSGFGTVVDKFKKFGGNILDGLKEGVSDTNKQSGVLGALGGFVDNFTGTWKKALGINSPSKLFKEYGKYTVEGYQIGIEGNIDMSTKSVKKWGEELTSMATASLPELGYSSSPTYNSSSVNTNIYNNAEEVSLMRQQNALLQALVSKDNVVISADSEGIFKMVQNKANNYTRQNGIPAFVV